jgi:TolB-like protein/Tfp pilus assembly protein PilF/tRNA A-37 threonylcarbamoyl transferase component Bud32
MIGKTISHYKIIEKLGEGGMGVVFKAEDTKLKRIVALKFFNPQMLGTEEDKTRFMLEAQAAARLDHPNICTVHEIDEVEDQTFIAMAYVDGKSLEEKVGSGVLEMGEALDIALQVAEGLREAHAKGIIHRDIKAANIMVSADGQAKIMDFGLAKLVGRSRLTKTATIMGTVAYMSPEQASGDSAIDHRTDIWSLGVVLYKMLTGYPPFDAPSDAALIHKIIYEQMKPASSLRSDVPPAVEDIIQKMLRKDPRERYQDMQSLIIDLKTARTRMVAVENKTSPSIAVLPFVDMSPAKDQEYFCDGLAEELINALTQIEGLHVVARTSAFSFKGQHLDVREIGKRLNVETVLEGSVRKAGNRLRITGQLVKVDDGYHLWSEKYDRNMDDIFAIQDEISEVIVSKLKPTLLKSEEAKLAKRHTVPVETYELYLKGRYFLNKATEEALRKAVDYFEQAIAIDPDYAQAYAGLADSYLNLPFYSFSKRQEAYQKGRRAAVRALEIDDTLAEAHTSLGLVKYAYDWDWKGAEKEIKQAIELNPGYASAHLFYAHYLVGVNRLDEAIAEMEQAYKLDPLCLQINVDIGFILYFAGRYDRAMKAFQKMIELDPNHPYGHIGLGLVYLQKLMTDEALVELERGKEASGSEETAEDIYIAFGYAAVGKRDKALDVLTSLLARSEIEYVSPFMLAEVYWALGDIEKGFEWLEKACDVGDVWLLYIQVSPGLAPLRSDPRYKAILRKMGLEA